MDALEHLRQIEEREEAVAECVRYRNSCKQRLREAQDALDAEIAIREEAWKQLRAFLRKGV